MSFDVMSILSKRAPRRRLTNFIKLEVSVFDAAPGYVTLGGLADIYANQIVKLGIPARLASDETSQVSQIIYLPLH